MEAYFKEVYEARQRRMGKGARLLGSVGTVFPNLSHLARQPRSIAVWHPRGALKAEAWRWFLVDQDAPAEVEGGCMRHIQFGPLFFPTDEGPSALEMALQAEAWGYDGFWVPDYVTRRKILSDVLGWINPSCQWRLAPSIFDKMS